MAIQTSDLLQRLSPTGYLGGGRPERQGGMERERLKLMREQFENTKQQQVQAMELSRLEEQGRMARAQLQHQGDMAQLDAQQAAATKAKKLEAYQKFTELNGSGDIEGARAMVPMMSALGMGVDLEGEEAGLPRYRVSMDPEADQKKETSQRYEAAKAGDEMGAAGIGYDTADETGEVAPPPGIASSGDMDSQGLTVAERVASTYGEPGQKTPMAATAEPSYTGGVPKNVLDMGAINSQAAARLNPALSGIIGGLPEEYQGSARSTASGIAGLGIPAAKAVEMFGKQQGDANALITGRLNAQDKMREDAGKGDLAQSKEDFDRYKAGFDTLGKEVASKYAVDSRLRTRGLNKQAMQILNNSTKEDDYLVLSLISRSFGERGATTEGDVARALGLPATSTWDQITGWITSRLDGGIPEPNKKALIGVLNKAIESNDGEINTFSDRLLELSDDPETDPSVARGIRDYWRATVPKDIRETREKQKHSQSAPGRAKSQVATAALDVGEVSIPDSSRIAKAHNNPGNLKFAGQGGATEGEKADDGGSWAQFSSPEAGLEALRAQIELDAGRGQTVREFVTKYAPPGSNDTEQYIAQAAKALRASPDDPLNQVDTYDVLRFVAKKESGTELPEQYGEPADKAMDEQKAAEGAVGDDAAQRKARLAELRKKYGRGQ